MYNIGINNIENDDKINELKLKPKVVIVPLLHLFTIDDSNRKDFDLNHCRKSMQLIQERRGFQKPKTVEL